MPKPENFDKLTPDQKRQARLEAWINHEGIEFTNPEAEKGIPGTRTDVCRRFSR